VESSSHEQESSNGEKSAIPALVTVSATNPLGTEKEMSTILKTVKATNETQCFSNTV
jgi:hypothetical protein